MWHEGLLPLPCFVFLCTSPARLRRILAHVGARTTRQHLQVNRKKKENDFQRYSQIERENFRLLDSMSRIMVLRLERAELACNAL